MSKVQMITGQQLKDCLDQLPAKDLTNLGVCVSMDLDKEPVNAILMELSGDTLILHSGITKEEL